MAQNKLYIGGLSYSTTEDKLRETFLPFGEIQDLIIITDRYTGRSKGFGFVTFASPADAGKAQAEMDGQKLDGRQIKVNVAMEKKRDERRF